MKILILSVLLLNIFSIISAQPLKIYCIDVDQGSSTLIVSPANKYILIDAGDYETGYNYGDTVLRLIRNLGITHLDYTLATHYHADHIGGMPTVIYGLSGSGHNDSILHYCYDRADTYTTTQYIYYKNAVAGKRRTIGIGETIDLGGGAFMFCVVRNGRTLLGDTVIPSDENDRCIGMVLKYGSFKLSIDGDLAGYNSGGYRDLETKIAPIVRNVNVLIVNHHGSRYSTNNVFLDSLRPQAATISMGVYPPNTYGFPKQEVINRLVNHNTYIYQMNNNSTGGTIPSGHGRILNTTAAITVYNTYYTINGDSYTLNPNGIEQNTPSNIPLSIQNFQSATVKIYNISGRLILTRLIQRPSENLLNKPNDWCKNLASGIYFLHITAVPSDHQSPLYARTEKVIVLPYN